jgi:serine/threonine protein kinase
VQRLHILRGVAYGLLTLHLSDLVHLDVMPANILLALLGSEIIAKLTDIGISWIVDPSSSFCAALTSPLCSATPAHLARRRLRSASWCLIALPLLHTSHHLSFYFCKEQNQFNKQQIETWIQVFIVLRCSADKTTHTKLRAATCDDQQSYGRCHHGY